MTCWHGRDGGRRDLSRIAAVCSVAGIWHIGIRGDTIIMRIPKSFRLAAALAAVVSGALYSVPAQAGDFFHCWRGCEAETWSEPIRKTIIRRVEVERGLYEIEREPAQYGWIKRKVIVSGNYKDDFEYKVVKKRILLKQYRNIAVYHRGQYRLVREKVEIYPEKTGWSYFSTKD
jgi:hypothetical protein